MRGYNYITLSKVGELYDIQSSTKNNNQTDPNLNKNSLYMFFCFFFMLKKIKIAGRGRVNTF